MATAIEVGIGLPNVGARVYLLEIQIGSTLTRVASEMLSVSSGDGDLFYDAGLVGLEIARSFSTDADTTEPDVPIELAPGTLDVGALLNAGHDIASAIGELSVIEIGDTYEQREVLVAGRVSEPVYGLASEPVSFSLRLGMRRRRVLIPDVLAKLERALWDGPADLPEGSWGFTGPFVFGAPGEVFGIAAVGAGRIAGSPGYAVAGPYDTAEILICEAPVEASTVWLAYADEEANDRSWVQANVVQYLATNRETMAFAALPASLNDASDRTRFLVRWINGGAAKNFNQDGAIQTAGELLEYLLHRYGDCDAERTAAAVELLPFRVDGYIDERVDILDWIRQNMLPLFPVALARSGRGLYPVVGRPWLDPSAPAPELSVARRELHRVGTVTYDGGDAIYNEIEIQYGLDCGTRNYLFTAVLTGDDGATPSPSLATTRRVQHSRARYGEQAKVIRSNIVSRPETANAIAHWHAQRYALPTRVASYSTTQLPRSSTLGSGIWVEDADRGIDHLCVLERIEDRRGGEQIITVRTVERAG